MTTLYSIPSPLLALAFMLLLLGGVDIGRRWSRRSPSAPEQGSGAILNVVLGAVLALLGLLLAFAFSLSAARYDVRRMLQLQESNAIGTLYLRADLLPTGSAEALRAEIRQFVDLRLALHDAADPQAALELHKQTQATQTRIWKLVIAAAQASPEADALSLPISAANEVFDISAARTMAYRSHVSEVILLMLGAVAFVSALLLGASSGGLARRPWLATLAYAGTLAMVLFTILELDRPRHGVIRIHQTLMEELRDSIKE